MRDFGAQGRLPAVDPALGLRRKSTSANGRKHTKEGEGTDLLLEETEMWIPADRDAPLNAAPYALHPLPRLRLVLPS